MNEARAEVGIVNASGLHARPCHALVRLAMEYDADLRVGCGGISANGKSILELMTLAAARGDKLDLVAAGPDAEELVAALRVLVAAGFEE